jgi:hypothetical protein
MKERAPNIFVIAAMSQIKTETKYSISQHHSGGSLNFGFSLPFRTLLMPKLPYPIWINVNEDCLWKKMCETVVRCSL